MKLQKNILKLKNVDSWHEAVFQCVAENDLGMSVTSTWVHVEGWLVRCTGNPWLNKSSRAQEKGKITLHEET